MINTFFTSDTHFGHINILEYEKENRPFSSIEEHDDELIKRWNSVVKPNDKVYHLGDFCLGGADNVIKIGIRLNGRKILVLGNHDVYPIIYYTKIFDRIYGALFWKEFILSHIPLHPDHTKNRVNAHGHLHSKYVKDINGDEDENYFCCSIERNNLIPFHIDEIREKLKK